VSEKKTVVVAGLGEVGKPLLAILKQHYNTIGVDIAPVAEPIGKVDVLHVCYPFEIPDFVGVTARYIDRFKPALTIIDSTIAVGTTRAVAERTGTAVVNSPVRGKHARMQEEMHYYVKFIGALDPAAGKRAVEHFEGAGFKTQLLNTPEASELGKLTETTYFGVLIAFAQEVERYCDQVGANYDEVIQLYDQINYLPKVKFFPGVIGGHCVMPNIKILGRFADSKLLNAIEDSNQQKVEREARKAVAGADLHAVAKVGK
jgi:UDP-N-acetyl-D-mannosaminuronate dehydrogenase